MSENQNPFTDADLVSKYTRAQALEDGVLVDVTAWANDGPDGMQNGFSVPVAFTRALDEAIKAIPPSLEGMDDIRGRAHDVLWLAALRARGHRGCDRFDFQVLLPYRGTRKRIQTFRCVISGGDDLEAVITIGFPSDF